MWRGVLAEDKDGGRPCLPLLEPLWLVRAGLSATLGKSASAAEHSLDGRRIFSDASAAQNGPRTCGGSALAATNLLRSRPCMRTGSSEVQGPGKSLGRQGGNVNGPRPSTV